MDKQAEAQYLSLEAQLEQRIRDAQSPPAGEDRSHRDLEIEKLQRQYRARYVEAYGIKAYQDSVSILEDKGAERTN